MILPDANLLLYVCDSASPFHSKAAGWWRDCLSGTEEVGLIHSVVFSFVRIATNPRAFEAPLSPVEANQHVRAWLARPNVQIIEPGPDHIEQVLIMLETIGTAANLVSDAQIAALAIEYGAVVHTADTDFLRFPGVRWLNPLTGMGSDRVRPRRK